MITPDRLLDFAFDLVMKAEHSEVYSRRAASAAYYAFFHEICQAGAALFAGDATIRTRTARSYDHGAITQAARAHESRAKASVNPQLAGVTRSFNRLREARERADYELDSTFSWDEAEELFWEALNATHDLREIRSEPATVEFLLDALLPKRTRRG